MLKPSYIKVEWCNNWFIWRSTLLVAQYSISILECNVYIYGWLIWNIWDVCAFRNCAEDANIYYYVYDRSQKVWDNLNLLFCTQKLNTFNSWMMIMCDVLKIRELNRRIYVLYINIFNFMEMNGIRVPFKLKSDFFRAL